MAYSRSPQFKRSFSISAGSLDHGIYKNFELRTIGVVTLCSHSIQRQHCLKHRGGELCATTELVALFQPIWNWLRFSKPIRQFMRIETNCPSQSKGWKSPACRHFIDMLGCDLEQFCNIPCAQDAAFFFQLIYQTHIRAPQQKTILPLTRMQSRLFKTVRAFRQTASSFQVLSGSSD